MTGAGQYNFSVLNGVRTVTVGGQPGSTALLSDAATYVCADISVRVKVDADTSAVDGVVYAALTLAFDASNYIIVRHRSSLEYGAVCDAIIVQNGEDIHCGFVIPATQIYELRIIHAAQSVDVMVRDDGGAWAVLGSTRTWTSSIAAVASVSCSNGTNGYRFSTSLISFVSKLNVLYGLEPAIDSAVTLFGTTTNVPDPQWARHEIKSVTLTLFDHVGVRDTGIFTYNRVGYYRVKQSSRLTADLITKPHKSVRKLPLASSNNIGLAFTLPYAL
jgi:hypothetical protein